MNNSYANIPQFVKFVIEPLGRHPRFQLELINLRVKTLQKYRDELDNCNDDYSVSYKSVYLEQIKRLNSLFAHIYTGKSVVEFLALDKAKDTD